MADIANVVTEPEEIEVTPEMIEAGLEALYCFPITEPDDASMKKAVVAVFSAMLSVRELAPGKYQSKG